MMCHCRCLHLRCGLAASHLGVHWSPLPQPLPACWTPVYHSSPTVHHPPPNPPPSVRWYWSAPHSENPRQVAMSHTSKTSPPRADEATGADIAGLLYSLVLLQFFLVGDSLGWQGEICLGDEGIKHPRVDQEHLKPEWRKECEMYPTMRMGKIVRHPAAVLSMEVFLEEVEGDSSVDVILRARQGL